MQTSITALSLRGFKSFAEVNLPLAPLNVLIGANGTGKSNFLSFFRMLGAITQGMLQSFVQRQGGAGSLLHYGAKQTQRILATVDFHDGEKPSRYEVQLAYGVTDRIIFARELVARDVGQEELQGFLQLPSFGVETSLLAMTSGPEDQAKAAAEVLANLKRIRVYHFHDTSDTAAVKQSADLHDNRSLHSDAGNLAAFLYMLKQAHPAHYAEIRDTVRLAFPLLDDFVLEPSRLNANKLLLTWRERGSSYELGPHQLSDGTLRFLCLAALLLQPFDHPDAPHIVTIDEPELGLHPYALTLLASMLKSASQKVQIIVSTQSASLLGAIDEPGAVVVVERKLGATVLRRCTEEELAPWLEDYSLGDIWEKGVLGGRP
jgi:predicted ATPase